MRDLSTRKVTSVHIYVSSNESPEKNRFFTYKDNLLHNDITDITTLDDVLSIIYLDSSVTDNIKNITIDFFNIKTMTVDFIIEILHLINSYQNKNYKEVCLVFNNDYLMNIENIDNFINSLENCKLCIDIVNYDNIPEKFLFESYTYTSIIYNFIITSDNEDLYYKKFLNHYFSISNRINNNAFRFISSPFRESFDIENSKFKSFMNKKEFDNISCNTYSDNIAIDLCNKKILKCYRLIDESPSVDLTNESLKNVLTYQNTNIFPLFDFEKYCNKCIFYNFNKKSFSSF